MKKKFGFLVFLIQLYFSSYSVFAKPMEPESNKPQHELSDECINYISKLYLKGYKWGWVRVPEMFNQKQSPMIDVFYYYRLNPDQTPTMYFNGGPSVSSHNFLNMTDRLPDSFVVMDQRGTGCSTPYPYKETNKTVEYIYWGTTGIVKDAESVRRQLKIPQWNILGQSFGGIIVLRYLESYPESILKAGSSGGAVANFSLTLGSKTLTPNWDLRFENQLYVLKEYFNTYPDDVDKVKKIVHEKKCLLIDGQGNLMCGYDALDYVVRKLLIGFRENWEKVHLVIKGLSASKKTRVFGEPRKNLTAQEWSDYRRYYENLNKSPDYLAVNNVMHFETSGEITIGLVDTYKFQRLGLQILGSSELLALTEYGRNFDSISTSVEAVPFGKMKQGVLDWSKIEPINTSKIRSNLAKYPDLKLTMWSGKLDYYMPRTVMALSCAQIGPQCEMIKLDDLGHDYYHQGYFEFLSPWVAEQIKKTKSE